MKCSFSGANLCFRVLNDGVASPSVKATRSPLSVIIIKGIATAPHSSGESELSRLIVRPLESDKLNDWSPLAEEAIADISRQ